MKKFFAKFSRNTLLLILVTMGLIFGGYFVYARYTQVMPQSAIYFLDEVKLPAKNQIVVVFSPHPDDETIAAGGYIYDSTKNGANVYIILVTDGNKHGQKDKRYQEFKTATGILGVPEKNLVFLNYADSELKKADKNELDKKFSEEITSLNPDFILYPDPLDTHPDHATTGQAVNNVIKSLSSKAISYQYLVHRNHYPQPKSFKPNLYLLPPMNLVNFDNQWQKLSLSSSAEDTKEKAVNSYKSQLRMPILKSTLLSCIRKNELFSITNNNL